MGDEVTAVATERLRRPWIPPLLRRLWRDGTTLQLGVDTPTAMMVGGIGEPERHLLAALDGRHDEAAVMADAVAAGGDPESLRALLHGLRCSGVVVDGPTAGLATIGGPAEVDRLSPELAGLALSETATGAKAEQVLLGRRGASVVVQGATRVGVAVASLVAAAGVGRVCVIDEGTTHVSDAVPGGLLPSDEGRSKQHAASAAIRRAAPSTDVATPTSLSAPDLVVLSDPWPRLDQVHGSLHALGTAHLAAAVREATAVVGPLVVPGRSSCLRCQDFHRTDRDPAWPALVAQLRYCEARPAEAGVAPLAVLGAAIAAMQVLAFLDGVGQPVTIGGTLELTMPDWKLRRRGWPPHPACGCLGTVSDTSSNQRGGGTKPAAETSVA